MNKLRKYGIIILMIAVSGLSVFLPVYIWPQEVSTKFDAVMFEDGVETSEVITIKIEGHFNRRFFGGSRFLGEINMEGAPITETYQDQNIQIKFGSDQIGVLIYLEEEGDARLVQKGYASIPKDLSYMVIVLTDGEKVTEADVGKGVFIAGPSTNKVQAIALVNEKLNKVLDEPVR